MLESMLLEKVMYAAMIYTLLTGSRVLQALTVQETVSQFNS